MVLSVYCSFAYVKTVKKNLRRKTEAIRFEKTTKFTLLEWRKLKSKNLLTLAISYTNYLNVLKTNSFELKWISCKWNTQAQSSFQMNQAQLKKLTQIHFYWIVLRHSIYKLILPESPYFMCQKHFRQQDWSSSSSIVH